MGWKEEHQNRKPEDYETPYEYRKAHLWKAYDKEEGETGGMKLISYFDSPSEIRKMVKGVTGKIMVIAPPNYSIKVNTKEAGKLLTDKMYTAKKDKKGRRVILRTEFLEMKQYETYDWIVLMNYLRDAIKSDCEFVMLTPKEFAIIQPKLTKKQELNRKVNSKTIGY